jgi:hypothetical protein
MAGHGSFAKIIQQISSPSFSHIEIGVWLYSCADLTWLDCAKVVDELNHPRFSELRKVHVKIRCMSFGTKDKPIDEAIGWVRREMSSLDNLGILSVTSF